MTVVVADVGRLMLDGLKLFRGLWVQRIVRTVFARRGVALQSNPDLLQTSRIEFVLDV